MIRQDRYRGKLDAALHAEAPGNPIHVALRGALKVRHVFDHIVGARRALAVEAEWEALKAVRHAQQVPSQQTQAAAANAARALADFYERQCALARG